MPQTVESQVQNLAELCHRQELDIVRHEGRIVALEQKVKDRDEADAARAQLAQSARRYAITTFVGVFAVLISLVALVLSQFA